MFYNLLSSIYIYCGQISHIVGIAAPPEFIAEVRTIVESHHNAMVLDRILAYHFGQRCA